MHSSMHKYGGGGGGGGGANMGINFKQTRFSRREEGDLRLTHVG
jgi:hypothetical protein